MTTEQLAQQEPGGEAAPRSAEHSAAQSGVSGAPLPQGAEKRQSRRYAVDEPALVIVGNRALTCRLCDISFGGAMLEGELPLQVGDSFRLMILDLPELVCRVAHSGNGFLGASFVNGRQLHLDLGKWIRSRGFGA